MRAPACLSACSCCRDTGFTAVCSRPCGPLLSSMLPFSLKRSTCALLDQLMTICTAGLACRMHGTPLVAGTVVGAMCKPLTACR